MPSGGRALSRCEMKRFPNREIPPLTKKTLRNFWRKVDVTEGQGPDGDCWEWTGCKNRAGYGNLSVCYEGFLAHRVAYAALVGTIPAGLHVLHRCDNPGCVNPAHLWIGTDGDYNIDRDAKGRSRHANGERIGASKLTAAQVVEIRDRYAAGGTSHYKLAAEYGVSQPMIGCIVRRTAWKHVE